MSLKKISNLFFCFCFCGIMLIPLTVKLIGLAPTPVVGENRPLASSPAWFNQKIRKWPSILDSWFNDHLAFRSHLLGLYIRYWEKGLDAPVKVNVTGRKNEMFMQHISPTVTPYLGVHPLSKEHLVNLKLGYAGTQAWFQSHGIPYLLVSIPDKTTLYPEWLPFWAAWKKGQSRYQQIVDVLSKSDIEYLDMLPVLAKQKSSMRLYNIWFDVCHWNGNALSIAYQTIGRRISKWSPAFTPRPEFYSIVPTDAYRYQYGSETVPYLRLQHPDLLENHSNLLPGEEAPKNWMGPLLLINKNQEKHGLWFMSDSYFSMTHTEQLPQCVGSISPLALHVQAFLRTHYNRFSLTFANDVLNIFRPTVVVEAFVERSQGARTRANDPLIRILGDIFLKTPSHILKPDMDLATVKTVNAEFNRKSEAENALTLIAENKDPIILLPSLKADNDGRVAVMGHIQAPGNTAIQLFYAQKDQGFSGDRVVTQPLKKGTNLIHLHVSVTPGEWVKLRLDPGGVPGDYHFLALPEAATRTAG
ncbi:hypothetical protein dsmv_2654 [Desulfococcus multivorans DSM 2059]|uniref:AlgX/AlgJ SGNH hydrolase-like domain-containing protein n=2 Tax=Desulfococcus multivorans TaxID=897 RepID=S7TQ27_DESML|nr:conserved uncharacterized protein [Desulfococcus multivorans]EPR39312.1 hypothetical protein dsmv_2654 [Desulfococcus multivorans DSM 2059]SKA12562.1 SGNH hydrolase-like domain-containing protein, acetyltransferase AlgX [Desulfococcus multivorans DSM 2059]